MATADQMRRLHPDPPSRHDDYHRAVRDAFAWRIDLAQYRNCEQPGLTQPAVLLEDADRVIAALLRHGPPGDPE